MKTITPHTSHVSLFGASPDTGNQGVNALHDSLLSALARRGIAKTTVFAFTPAKPKLVDKDGKRMDVRQLAAFRTKRFYRSQSFSALRAALRFGIRTHAGAEALSDSNAVLDFSAGDSFTDLYGWDRFMSVMEPKLLAIQNRIPLILLPQTIGPFRSDKAKSLATKVVKSARQVWARDDESFELLHEMLEGEDEPKQFRRGVDLAFMLEPKRPKLIPEGIASWLSGPQHAGSSMIGVNVSGLIFNAPKEASEQFGLQTDYRLVLIDFLTWLLRTTPARILLVPHVLTKSGSRESDFDAATELRRMLPSDFVNRVSILSPNFGAAELKWFISKLDWFCGTRMHSTIAALGSGVPTAALAYSMKTRGVFEKCGLASEVFEMRHLSTASALEQLKASFLGRQNARARLVENLPSIRQQANEQMDAIVDEVQRYSPGRAFQTLSDDSPYACSISGKVS
jgi:colanic acid/amylovoran biosynthesis protein